MTEQMVRGMSRLLFFDWNVGVLDMCESIFLSSDLANEALIVYY